MIVAGLIATHFIGKNPTLGNLPQLLSFAGLSMLAMQQFFGRMKDRPSIHTQAVCYLAVICQYYWIHIHWYGFFVVFIPVFMFLYLPIGDNISPKRDSTIVRAATLHWVMMTTVFCLSHAAYLLILPQGRGLVFFVVLITEVADAVRMLLARNETARKLAPILSCVTAIITAVVVGPAFTPLTFEHTILAGFVLGVAGSIGHKNLSSFSDELGIEKDGALERIESLAYTAPIFLHGYHYFDYPWL